MTNYREILRLKNMGFNNRQIADSSGATRQTVIAVLQRAAACELSYQDAETLSDRELAKLLFQQGANSKPMFMMADYEWVHRELVRPGVTLQLLWLEYCDKCISGGATHTSSQFKKYYRNMLLKRKQPCICRASPVNLWKWTGRDKLPR